MELDILRKAQDALVALIARIRRQTVPRIDRTLDELLRATGSVNTTTLPQLHQTIEQVRAASEETRRIAQHLNQGGWIEAHLRKQQTPDGEGYHIRLRLEP